MDFTFSSRETNHDNELITHGQAQYWISWLNGWQLVPEIQYLCKQQQQNPKPTQNTPKKPFQDIAYKSCSTYPEDQNSSLDKFVIRKFYKVHFI